MFNLAGKKVYITGGSSGIGRAVAESFIESLASVVIVDITDATAIAAEIGATYVQCNVADEDSVAMNDGGSIINTSSMAGIICMPGSVRM